MNNFLMSIVNHISVMFIKIVGSTWRYNLQTPMPQEPVIYSYWHRNILPLMYLHRKQKCVLLISSSKDGDLIAKPAELMGYKTARGSSRRGGSAASRELIKLAKDNILAITPDGPKGPSQKIKNGIIYISYLSKSPIVPAVVDVQHEKIFNSWDNFRLPYLFSKINVTYGEKIYVDSKKDIEKKVTELQNAMDKLTKENKVRNVK